MIPKCKCLNCGRMLWDDKPMVQPTKGSYVVCVFCAHIMVFNSKLKLYNVKRDAEIPELIQKGAHLVETCIRLGVRGNDIYKLILKAENKIKSQSSVH